MTKAPLSIDQVIKVALVGNPNTGRTSLSNQLTGAKDSVGNYARVTVNIQERQIAHKGWNISIVDLPGVYSLSSQSEEEIISREYIFKQKPDLIVNVLDAGNLERNLLLTTELIEMGAAHIFVLNMTDEAIRKGINIDKENFALLLGGPVVETVARKGQGVKELLDKIVQYAENSTQNEATKINYDEHLELAIKRVSQQIIQLHPSSSPAEYFSLSQARWLAIKLLEGDHSILRQEEDHFELIEGVEKERQQLQEQHGEEAEMMLISGRYGFANGLLMETVHQSSWDHKQRFNITQTIDAVLLNKYAGLPLFLSIMWLMFEATFTLGQYPADWIDAGVQIVSETLSTVLPESLFKRMLIDGVVAGVGQTIVFLPNIVILFLFIAVFSETGYMARSAFLVDRFMHGFGLHGKAFIPMVTGFGCNVPAIMATRTIENPKDRLVAILINPHIPQVKKSL